jgi:hypothetical protein
MSEVTKEQIEEALKLVVDPYTEQDPLISMTARSTSTLLPVIQTRVLLMNLPPA